MSPVMLNYKTVRIRYVFYTTKAELLLSLINISLHNELFVGNPLESLCYKYNDLLLF